MNQQTSSRGVAFVANEEGFVPRPMADAGNTRAVGYGHQIQPGESFSLLTEPEARALLMRDLRTFENAVNGAVQVPLAQHQFDALISLAYNIGAGAFRSSTLVRKLNARDYQGAAAEFSVWRIADGVIDGRLVKRRDREEALFVHGDYGKAGGGTGTDDEGGGVLGGAAVLALVLGVGALAAYAYVAATA